ncbi:conserved hypothetical protein [Methylocella tundrae]|uniref:Uncharacterized protein n=1 Tax=Methylocella tundrae TaxID=227605 RepID=A0A4V6YUI2_METTU|nr:hypothetical protein [Methylocella tundrae]WPP06060.1 hypothetical protein SIN04_09755 [Methylocella tundrae]VFU08654.1 conserved protein of unknown function [Methylocella tundrae]VTZ23318.1 conserved hypothetical protein [Methylocella tundrae]VTZ48575.1 conserved hypothetical protein [Methylocella tundrae]
MNNRIIVDVLVEASRLLETKGWNKFAMARNDRGEAVNLDSSEASCYCLSGALCMAWRAVDPANEEFYFKYFEKKFSDVLRESHGFDGTFTQWNDSVATSRDHVLNVIQSVITSLLDEGPYKESPPLSPRFLIEQEKRWA